LALILPPRWTTLRPHLLQSAYFRSKHRFNVNPSGRRSGKTELAKRKLVKCALRGTKFPRPQFGAGAPTNAQAIEIYWQDLKDLSPRDQVLDISESHHKITYKVGSELHVVGLDKPERTEGKPWDGFVLDEYGNMKADVWDAHLRPALSDRMGWADFIGVPEGKQNHYYTLAEEARKEFLLLGDKSEYGYYHWPSADILPEGEIEAARRKMHPLVFQQEYGGMFVSFSGVELFEEDKLLQDGKPVEFPDQCDCVFAVIDSATKSGPKNDGTGCGYYAKTNHGGYPLILLDWDYVQIEGALLEEWLPSVFTRLEHLSRVCGARSGSIGALIEDKDSGQVLLQKAANNGWPASPLDSKLTALGKDGRALAASGHHYCGDIKISREAYEKIMLFKGVAANHYIRQVTSFTVGDPNASKRADEFVDIHAYAISVALGNAEGF
jgi:hypothetical protein